RGKPADQGLQAPAAAPRGRGVARDELMPDGAIKGTEEWHGPLSPRLDHQPPGLMLTPAARREHTDRPPELGGGRSLDQAPRPRRRLAERARDAASVGFPQAPRPVAAGV